MSENVDYVPTYVTANGIRFAFLEEGTGPLVLLMHGFPDTAHTWDDIRSKIAAKGYRAVSPFLRGYAPSEIPKRDTDAETLSRDVLELITALGEKQAILIGHDWGATAVYGAAAIDPSRVSKLIALAIPHPATLKPSPKKLWGVRHFFAYKRSGAAKKFVVNDFAEMRVLCKRWSPKWDPTDEELAPVKKCFSDPASCEAAFGYYRALTFRPPKFMRARIAVPTIVFSGTDDPMTDRNDYVRGQRMFTGEYTIEEMPGGHFLHREHPETFAKQLLAHL